MICGSAPVRHISVPGASERWFRSLKSECLRISEYENPRELRKLIADYVEQYNHVRPHQSLDYDTPASWYYSGLMAA